MRIALTFNEKRLATEAHAEFDSIETIHELARMLASLGHVVTPVEVSRPVDELVAAVQRLAPDLVFNLAEGTHGRFREAFYPALFEHLGLPHTGSSASTLALCLDKALSKRIVAAARVPTPASVLVRCVEDLGELADLALPVIAKPNFEGSSKGITQASVVTEASALVPTVTALLAQYPAGILVEQYIAGTDVAVGWVDGLGLLPAIGYAYAPTGEHAIYDLALKQGPPEHIDVVAPAPLDAITSQRLAVLAKRAFAALSIAGYGRADFRIAEDGAIYFLEMNPLPTLDPQERDLYLAASAIAKSPRDLLASIVDAAVRYSASDVLRRPGAVHVLR